MTRLRSRQNLKDYWPEAYSPDLIEMLRERIRTDAERDRKDGWLTWATIVVCFALIVSGVL